MKMEARDIQYFAVVARCGNVGRAAEELGLSQPALSKSLRRLERAVGAKLVTRTPKGIDLTAVGSALSARARGLRLSLDDIAREAADLSQGRAGLVRIGIGPALSGSLLPATCAAMLKEAPRVALKIVVATDDIVAPALSAGELDLGVMVTRPSGYDHDELVHEHLFEEAFVVLASARHRLARKKRVTLADLAQERWSLAERGPFRDALCQAFVQSGLPPPTVAVETIGLQFRLELLRLTNLVGFGPRQYLRQSTSGLRLVELPVKELSYRRSFGAHYRKDAYLSPAARRFMEILKTTAKEIDEEKDR